MSERQTETREKERQTKREKKRDRNKKRERDRWMLTVLYGMPYAGRISAISAHTSSDRVISLSEKTQNLAIGQSNLLQLYFICHVYNHTQYDTVMLSFLSSSLGSVFLLFIRILQQDQNRPVLSIQVHSSY